MRSQFEISTYIFYDNDSMTVQWQNNVQNNLFFVFSFRFKPLFCHLSKIHSKTLKNVACQKISFSKELNKLIVRNQVFLFHHDIWEEKNHQKIVEWLNPYLCIIDVIAFGQTLKKLYFLFLTSRRHCLMI